MQIGWLFTNVLIVAGTCYGWANPFFGLMVFYTFSVLRPRVLWFWMDFPIQRYSFYVGLATIAGWLLNGMGDSSGLRGIRMPLVGLFIYLLAGTFTWQFTSIYPPAAWDALYPQLTIGLMSLVTVTLVRNPKAIRTFAWVITASVGYLAWVFNSQYFFDGWNRIWIHGFGGIDNNGAAMIMVMGVPLAFFLGVHEKKHWVKALCFIAVALLVHVVLLSFSRGGQLGLCFVGFAIFIAAMLLLPNKLLTTFLTIVFVALTLHLAGAEVRTRFWSIFADPVERDASAASRFDTWRAAWMCMIDHPLGVGPRNFNLISHQYGLAPGKSVHNLFLQTGADYGFVGMIGLAVFYFGSMIKTFLMARTAVAKRLNWPRYYGYMVFIALGGFLVSSTFIGMESVEFGFLISLLGLSTVSYVNRLAGAEPAEELRILPELEQVPPPGEYPDLSLA